MLTSVGILSPSRGSGIKRLNSSDMPWDTQWMAVTFRATFFSPLAGLSKQIDRLLEGYCFQILATNRDPEARNGRVIQTATHLTWILAEYLADTIACLLRSILDHVSKILFDNDTQPLLTPKFWILPLYRELLNSARRIRPSASSERARGCTGLVKVMCKENKEQKGKRKNHAGTPHPIERAGLLNGLGRASLMSTLYVWFPSYLGPDDG